MIVDYDGYKMVYAGSLIPSSIDFMAAESAAVLFVKRYVTITSVVPVEVQLAICAASELYYAHKQRLPGVQSENTDGYSVGYESKSLETSLLEAVKPYIGDQIKSVRWC